MSHTYAHNPVHVVFSTQERRKLISKESQPRLWAYLAGVCKKQRIFVHEIGGVEDHLHMLIEIPLTVAFSDALQEIKTSSSRWMRREFAWQRGFDIFGVSASNVNAVVRYIRTQEAHHKKMTFEEEFIALLKRHGGGLRSPLCVRIRPVSRLRRFDLIHLLPTAMPWATLWARLRRFGPAPRPRPSSQANPGNLS